MSLQLGVNIDHVATLRQARGCRYPDPIQAAMLVARAGADSITLHLREDRRHINDRDVKLLKEVSMVPINLEMAATEEMIQVARAIKPEHACIVPEKREEVTTEGGLDVVANQQSLAQACKQLQAEGIEVSLFIDTGQEQIDATLACGADAIELHTGHFVNASQPKLRQQCLQDLIQAAQYADDKGLIVNAGHGLHYHNVKPVAAIPQLQVLNIGHSIIAHAVFVGLEAAVKEMKQLMLQSIAVV
ncbi:MAG: pyridoxine 5'-phosphate synthase [Gammaproteobacteria bacterium]|nr:pyridoxine 5'-phosphate synthase [Gammaproteobacteria bacterium]MCH9743554.1 pyridoxine 5'-phosphate synthase [Gammaproteobacteria bacterium]